MKIEGPSKSDNVSTSKKSKAAGDGGDAFKTMLSGGARPATGATPSHTIASIDVLLAAQGAEDPAEKKSRKRAMDRGDKLLDMLENMRMAMLSGGISVGHMISLADTVAQHREKITDPALVAILDEIDLRAQIELAKMARAFEEHEKSRGKA